MGRPLNDKYLGDPSSATRTFPAVVMSKAWMTGQNAVSTNPVYIVKQTGTTRYLVTDGTVSGYVQLRGYEPAAAGDGAIYVTPFVAGSETGATFTATYKCTGATVANGGSGYTQGDTLTISNGITLTVATVNAGAVATVTVATAGSRGTVNTAATTGVASTGGTGTGATFNLTYNLNAVTVGGSGTGYTANEPLTFVGLVATAAPVAKITGVTGNGVPSGVTITSAGTGVTTSATSVVTSNSLVKTYARRIKNRTVTTWDGQTYMWDPYAAAAVGGQADLPRDVSKGTESTGYLAANEAANAGSGGHGYFNVNSGPTAKQGQIFATAGIPGGQGSSSQAAAIAGGTTGIYNPSAPQRKAPTKRRETSSERIARLKAERKAEINKKNKKQDEVQNTEPSYQTDNQNEENTNPFKFD